jgi:hypothetical protein
MVPAYSANRLAFDGIKMALLPLAVRTYSA